MSESRDRGVAENAHYRRYMSLIGLRHTPALSSIHVSPECFKSYALFSKIIYKTGVNGIFALSVSKIRDMQIYA